MRRSLAKFTTQCWSWRPGMANWYGALLKSALGALDGRSFDVTRIMDSSLREVACKIRPLTAGEVRRNGRSFAPKSHSVIEFSLKEYDSTAAREQLLSDNDTMPVEEIETLLSYFIGYELERFCESIVFLVNLSHCGVLSTENTRVTVGRDLISQGSYHILPIDSSSSSYPFLTRAPSMSVSFEETLEWSKSCGGFWGGKATKNVEKALMFFSHGSERGASPLPVHEILWITAALEALACDNSSSISQQLRKRLPQVCSRIDFKDLAGFVRDAYDFRSRLFHGDIAIDSRLNPDEVSWQPQRYDARLEHFALGLRLLLISALWDCIAKGSYEIRFEENPVFVRAQ